jgi:uncharacterized protein involved in outer membrane biogenesis
MRRFAAVLLVLFAGFGLLSYFWLPGYAKAKLEQSLATTLHRPVSIQSIKVQPYALAITLRGLRVGQSSSTADAPPLAALDELYVNLSLASLRHQAPVITHLRLKAPSIHVERGTDGRYSISDLLDDWLKAPVGDAPTPVARFSVTNIQVEGGRIDFVDRLKGSRQEVRELKIGIPFIANLTSNQNVWVDPHISAHVNGAEFSMSGILKPFADKREASLALTLEDFDLTRIDEYSPIPLAASIVSARLDSALNLTFSQAEGKTPQISVGGDFSLRKIEIIEAGVKEKSARRLLKLPELTVKLAKADAQDGLAIERIRLVSPEIQLRRNRNGQIDWLSLIAPVPAGVNETSGPSSSLPIRINEILLSNGKLSFEDEMVKASIVVDELDVSLENLDTMSAAPVAVSVHGKLNQHGRLQASGNMGWAPVLADLRLDLRDIDLVPLQAWVADRFNATLTRGTASFQGSLAANGEPLQFAVSGNGRLANVSVADAGSAAELLRWSSLDIGEIKLGTAPVSIDLGSLALANFFARVIISPEGKINLNDLVRRDEVQVDSAPELSAEASAANPLRVGRITLQGGRVNFSDHFIKPNYSANLTELGGRIGPLNATDSGEIEIRGSVDRSAPLEVLGKVSPLGAEMALDINARAKGIDLPALSPYSIKYLGYAIEKGKLSVDVKYHVTKGELTAEHNIFLDQLSLGEKIESPEALSLPINLAVALLKNSRGEIDLNLPISGSLNDPQFSVGAIVMKVLANVLTKAITAPFALLGSLSGGSEELSHVDFPAGRTVLDPEAEIRLGALGKALTERPGLRLDITGLADPENDREGLKRAALERKVKTQKLAEVSKAAGVEQSMRDIQVNPDEYPKYLELAYKDEKFPKPKNVFGFTQSLPPPEMEQLMLANIQAGEVELRQLADRRARAAREWLIGKGGISVERLFVLAPKIETEANGQRVGSRAEFSLK